MKRFYLFLYILLFASNVNAQKLTDDAKIYILTCSPGEELYQAFGHTAFWVVDESIRYNYIFHYGTFNYSDPNFYTNFIKGRLNYMLALESYQMFIDEYSGDGRDVWKMEMNLTQEKKQQLFDFLVWKSQPENKYYLYDFFMDNCATRVRDVVEDIYGDSLIYADYKIDITYREAITPYLRAMPWTRFGVNLLLGMPADKELDYSAAMFLPDYIDSVYAKAKIITPNGEQNLGINRDFMIQSNYKIGEKPFFNPGLIFWLIFVILSILTFIEHKKKKKIKIIDNILLFILGLAGVIMLFMWFGTDHSPTKWNLNILWAFPTHILVAFVLYREKFTSFFRKYMLIFGSLNFLLAITMWFMLPQQYDVAVFPILLLLSIRFLAYYQRERK